MTDCTVLRIDIKHPARVLNCDGRLSSSRCPLAQVLIHSNAAQVCAYYLTTEIQMNPFKGLFRLQTPHDLLNKLRHDFGRLENDPLDEYSAFDFFVTAYHLLDWTYPDAEDEHNRGIRRQIEQGNLLLQVCSHIANGSKHFQTARHHRSVQDAYYEHGAFDPNAFNQDAFQVDKLTIRLQDQAATRFGESIGCVELARKLLDFWEGYDKLAV
jgi:hypothetical protein